MAFLMTNFTRQTAGYNSGLDTVVSPAINGPQIFSYQHTVDVAATIEAANYFSTAAFQLYQNDFIFVVAEDATVLLQVTAVDNAVNPATITTETVGFASSVGTANIQNNAVTYAKIQEASAGSVLLANPTGGAANYEEITLGAGLVFSGTTLAVDPLFDNHASGTLTAAQVVSMYATPISVLAAPASGKAIIVEKFEVEYVYVTTAYATDAGSIVLTYGSSAHSAANPASAGIALTGLTDQTASTTSAAGGSLTGLANTAINGVGLFISNTTAASSGAGADGTLKWNLWYRVITL